MLLLYVERLLVGSRRALTSKVKDKEISELELRDVALVNELWFDLFPHRALFKGNIS